MKKRDDGSYLGRQEKASERESERETRERDEVQLEHGDCVVVVSGTFHPKKPETYSTKFISFSFGLILQVL